MTQFVIKIVSLWNLAPAACDNYTAVPELSSTVVFQLLPLNFAQSISDDKLAEVSHDPDVHRKPPAENLLGQQ